MSGHDEELERIREGVSCATLLERLPPPWRLDRAGSSRDSLKYRRGKGEIIIVSHGGRGWWDAGGTAKGDVFRLVRYLRPDLNFGHIRRLLREMVGLPPSYPPHPPGERAACASVPAPLRWARARPLRPGSRAWDYLAGERGLPAVVLRAASAADAIREGGFGTPWFAHRDAAGSLTGFEMRGPAYRGFAKGADKTLFRLPGGSRRGVLRPRRLVVAEAPIDALSTAAVERLPGDTLYLATGGGMGPGTVAALDQLLQDLAAGPGALLAAATDNDPAGERYAALLATQATAVGVAYERLRPPGGLNDWNDAVKRRRES